MCLLTSSPLIFHCLSLTQHKHHQDNMFGDPDEQYKFSQYTHHSNQHYTLIVYNITTYLE